MAQTHYLCYGGGVTLSMYRASSSRASLSKLQDPMAYLVWPGITKELVRVVGVYVW